MANGENLFGEPGRHSPWTTWQQLEAADPDVIITMPCGFDLHRAASEMYVPGKLKVRDVVLLILAAAAIVAGIVWR